MASYRAGVSRVFPCAVRGTVWRQIEGTFPVREGGAFSARQARHNPAHPALGNKIRAMVKHTQAWKVIATRIVLHYLYYRT
jgi:hypothetical protein